MLSVNLWPTRPLLCTRYMKNRARIAHAFTFSQITRVEWKLTEEACNFPGSCVVQVGDCNALKLRFEASTLDQYSCSTALCADAYDLCLRPPAKRNQLQPETDGLQLTWPPLCGHGRRIDRQFNAYLVEPWHAINQDHGGHAYSERTQARVGISGSPQSANAVAHESERDRDAGHSSAEIRQGTPDTFKNALSAVGNTFCVGRPSSAPKCSCIPGEVPPVIRDGGKSPQGKDSKAHFSTGFPRRAYLYRATSRHKNLRPEYFPQSASSINSYGRHFSEVAMAVQPRWRGPYVPEMRPLGRVLAVHLLLLLCSVPFARVCKAGCGAGTGYVGREAGEVTTHPTLFVHPQTACVSTFLALPTAVTKRWRVYCVHEV